MALAMRCRPALLLVILVAGCAPAAPGIQPVAHALAPAAISSSLLGAHNRERAAAGVPPLVWDHALASAAAVHARRLAALGVLRHAPRQARPGQGENLWMGTTGAFLPQQMVGSWASERAEFRPGIFPGVSRTGNWSHVGHYSQMIWPTTSRLGCGIAGNARFEVLVCRYTPAGNVDGRRVP